MSLSHHLEDEDSHMRISRRHTLDHSNGDLHVLASTAISIFFFMGTIRHVFAGAEKNVLGEESDDYLLNI